MRLDQSIFEEGEQARLRSLGPTASGRKPVEASCSAVDFSIRHIQVPFFAAKVCNFVHSIVRPPGLFPRQKPRSTTRYPHAFLTSIAE
jgi:hypothetical protein